MLGEAGVGLDRREANEDEVAGHNAGEHSTESKEGAHVESSTGGAEGDNCDCGVGSSHCR